MQFTDLDNREYKNYRRRFNAINKPVKGHKLTIEPMPKEQFVNSYLRPGRS